MSNPFHNRFAAVFYNEVLLNTKRVAPYALMLLFAANAVLWWGWGPAVARGWATNSDFYIQRNFTGFSFILGLPIFTAIIMGDPVVRDFRLGVDPLIFSKPLSRAAYLLGKFFGNFFVLVCCQSVFALTLLLLQWVPFSGMVTLPARVGPYFKHFLFVVVISHLALAAFYFAAGTLTRSAKVVYGLAACFYPAYIAFQLFLTNLPAGFRVLLDPLGSNVQSGLDPWKHSADFLNQYVANYGATAYANRASMLVVSALFLLVVYFRFKIAPPNNRSNDFTTLTLSSVPDRVSSTFESVPSFGIRDLAIDQSRPESELSLPKVIATEGPAATLFKIRAALDVEFRLLRAERGLIILAPLVIFISLVEVAFYRVVPAVSYSVTYATNTANTLLLVLASLIVFYTGETMHRDREVKIEPVLWSMPIPNSVLLLSKCFAVTLLALSLVATVGLMAVLVQLLRGHTPVDVAAYLRVYGILVVPGVVFITSAVVAFNVLLRNKYLTYVVAVGAGAGLFYLYSAGYNHWLYNPLLYQLWTYADLTSLAILAHRLYCLAAAAAFVVLAHFFFERRN